MKMIHRILYVGVLILLLLGCSTQPGSSQPQPVQGQPQPPQVEPPTPGPGDDVAPGVRLTVTASQEKPAAGESIQLRIEMQPQEDMQGAKLTLELPAQASLDGEAVLWRGDLAQGKPQVVQADIKVLEWPFASPVKVTLTNDIATYWAFWPAQGTEPMPSVVVELQADPPLPAPGQPTRFIASMTAVSDFSAARGVFELPPEFVLDAGSNLEWSGDLPQGVTQSVEISATPVAAPGGTVRFTLDLGQGEVFSAALDFGEKVAPQRPYRPEGTAVEGEQPTAPDGQDAPPPAPDETLEPQGGIPLVDFTVVQREWQDGQAALTVFVLANQELTNGQVVIQLPPGLELLEGGLEWQGDLQAGELISLELLVAMGENPPDGALQIDFTSDQGSAEPYIYTLNPPETGPPDGENPLESAPAEGAPPEEPAGTLYLSGRFMYDENLTTGRSIYFARVEVYDDDDISADDFVCSDTTDANGYWSCSGTAGDTWPDSTVEIYAMVRAYNSNFGKVKESNGNEYRFKTSNHSMPESGGTHNFGTWYPGTQGGNFQDGAFHIHRMGAYGWGTTHYSGGETPPDSGSSHFANFVWPDTDSDNSSEYGSWTVYIEGPGSTDPDEWDESVILHEYGHYLMDQFAILGSVNYCHPPTEPTPCSHSFNSHEDPTTAYIEGWPNYFQFAARQYYGLSNPHIYYETTWSFNLETSWHDASGTWDDAESTTAGIMLDLNDSSNDDQNSDGVGDAVSLGHSYLHKTFSDVSPSGYGTPTTIHGFYTAFYNRYAYDTSLLRIFFEHGINKDFTSPNGSVSINGGATYATSTSVSLSLSASDPTPGTGVTHMRFLNSGGFWSAWWPYSTSKSWTLNSGDGAKVVYAQFRDGAGNTSSSTSNYDLILLDTQPPNNPTSFWGSHTPATWSNDNTILANWSGASDATSGVKGYGHHWSNIYLGVPSQVMNTSGTSDTSSPLSDGTWYLHIITVDNAGNWRSTPAHYGPFYIDTVAPSSSVSSLPATSCPSFSVSWSGSDPAPASGMYRYTIQYRVGAGSWVNWYVSTAATSAKFGPTLPVIPQPGQTYSFRVIARDLAGNWETYPASADASTTALACIHLPLVVR